MVEIYSICGEWKFNETLQWEFLVEMHKGASVFEVDDIVTYKDLIEMVSEDFGIDCSVNTKNITLSYGLPMVEDSPPVYLRNDRQLRSFVNKIKEHPKLIRLCVTISDKCSTVPLDDVGSNINSKTISNEEICAEENNRSAQLLQPLNTLYPVLSHDHQQVTDTSGTISLEHDYSNVPSHTLHNQKENTRPIGASYVASEFSRAKQQAIQRSVGNGIPSTVANRTPCSTIEKDHHSVLINAAPDLSPVPIPYSTRGTDDIFANRYFKNKEELLFRMQKWALEWKFEFKTLWSNKSRVILGCVDDKCTWRMSASKVAASDYFVVKKYVHGHNCDTTHRNANHRQGTTKLLGTLLCSNYGEKKYGLKPKQIMEQVRLEHGVHMNYKQAWRVKEYAQNLIRGTHEDNYYNLSKWLFMLQEKNPGSIVYLEMDATGKFKYTFVAFGPSIRGFALMRRVIAVDGTFLKGKFKGTLLGACAQDGDLSLYPLAFGIVDSENEAAWSWFFKGLKNVIPDASDLVFVSDRAHAIAKALSDIYPLAHHGICRIHLLNNLKPKYGRKGLLPLVEAAANAYTRHEFSSIFSDIRSRSLELATYLEDFDFRKWARSYAPSNRYNIMTTNIAESLNSMLNLPRELPIMSLLETIRLTLTTWFHERRKKAAKHNNLVTPRVVKEMVQRYDAAMVLDVFQVDRYEFEVKDETRKYVVHLKNKQCTCCIFDIDKIPCIHAIAAAKRSKMDENQFVDEFYSTETWRKAYVESIHPCGDLTTCEFPASVGEFSCAPPSTKQSSGRPPKKRIRSVGEFGVPGSKTQGYRCSRCGQGGHNKSTCRSSI